LDASAMPSTDSNSTFFSKNALNSKTLESIKPRNSDFSM
jgi:hypothetical protein